VGYRVSCVINQFLHVFVSSEKNDASDVVWASLVLQRHDIFYSVSGQFCVRLLLTVFPGRAVGGAYFNLLLSNGLPDGIQYGWFRTVQFSMEDFPTVARLVH